MSIFKKKTMKDIAIDVEKRDREFEFLYKRILSKIDYTQEILKEVLKTMRVKSIGKCSLCGLDMYENEELDVWDNEECHRGCKIITDACGEHIAKDHMLLREKINQLREKLSGYEHGKE